MIEVKNLSKKFEETIAVSDFSLKIEKGEIFGLVGPDGAGKTTLIRLLATVMEPNSAEGKIADFSLTTQREEIKKIIGYMPQKFGLYGDLTVKENLEFFADIYLVPKENKKKRIEELLEFSRLTQFQKRLAEHLSGGMKQKLGLACAMMQTPQVLLLDEPTNGVDPVSRREFWQILYSLLEKKVTILISTPYMDEAERCQRVGMMDKGKLLKVDHPDELKKLFPLKVIELVCENTREAKAFLEKEKQFPNVILFGDRLHIWCEDFEQGNKLVEDKLSQKEIGIKDKREIAPRMEDVFFFLSSEKGK
jgi:ABC-2 type transport system ATP-binding protein